jgi:Subtilase family
MESFNSRSGRDLRVRVDEDSVLARYADSESRSRSRLLGAIGTNRREPMLFIADEVLVDGDDKMLVEQLTRDYQAEVVPELPIPPAPEQLLQHRRHTVDVGAMPGTVRLRFAAPPALDHPERVLETALAQEGRDSGDVTVSSEFAAHVAALVARLANSSIGLNMVANTCQMPLSTANEDLLGDPFQWQAFAGRTRMVEAWQLVDSIRQLTGNRFITIGVLDGGFWLDASGTPLVAAGQSASDFGTGVMQLNLQNEGQPAGGHNPSTCGGQPCRWHGNGVASAAAATINNAAGAAGAAGNVALPFLFRSDLSVDQILRCVRLCTAWQLDVLNMSFSFRPIELFFRIKSWEQTFQFASDNDLVVVASAGNSGLDITNDNLRPATRTPGVLTVGWLDTADNAHANSNYGSSVGLWAPGTSIPVAPDGASSVGSTVSGTSLAAPIVSGVAAMMRFANDALTATDIRQTLIANGWSGSGRVSKGLDAYASLFAAIHQTLPDNGEPNNTPATARDLLPTGSGGTLAPSFGGFTARSSATDRDYWKFRVDTYSTVTVAADWYERLASLEIEMQAEDPDTREHLEMTKVGNARSGRVVFTGLLSPGVYRVCVGGTGLTAYRLLVTHKPSPLLADLFESNDSFARAANLLFVSTKWSVGVRTWPPGTYDATLHLERGVAVLSSGKAAMLMNDDYFRLHVPSRTPTLRPRVSISHADELLDVTLYDGKHAVIQTWPGVREMFAYPPENSVCFLKVSSNAPTRYQITTRMDADPKLVPGRIQQEIPVIPKWWGGPAPLRLDDVVTHYLVDVNEDRGDGDAIVFERPSARVQLELLDSSGEVMRAAETVNDTLVIDTRDFRRGSYVLRASKDPAAAGALSLTRMAPPLR